MVERTASTPARGLCAGILTRWLETGEFPDRMLPHAHPANALIQEIVFGSLRWYGALQWRIKQLVPRDPDLLTMGFLLTGFYQLCHMDNIPPHAAVNETIEAAKHTLDPARCRFLNAVLRNALRQKDSLETKMLTAPRAAQWSHPAILIQRWQQTFGPEKTQALCNWNNQRPTVSLRVFAEADAPSRAHMDALPPHPTNPEHFRLVPPGVPVQSLPGFKEGAFYVQDPATELAVELLDPRPGMQLLDACAAPGGKTFACAARMQNKGNIIAIDRHLDRLERMAENIKRMPFSIIHMQRADATRSVELPQGPFDRILLDVPCSNSGVLQRRPDARWRITEERIATLADLQHRFLDATAPLLARQGVLVYSTCSLEPEENEKCVQAWIAHNPGYTLCDMRLSLPPESGMDGAFAARIERNPNT